MSGSTKNLEYLKTHSLISNGGEGSKRRVAFTLAEVPEARQHGSKQAAFTLAEVLITLGIIGIVAAMTIPTLIKSHNEKVTVTKVKKMYSTLSQAYLMNKAQDEIVLQNTQSYDADGARELAAVFIPYLKIAKDCGTTEKGCIFEGTYKQKNGSPRASYGVHANPAYRVLLADGSSIWFRRTTEYVNAIWYDVNGDKEPNRYGYDTFQFYISDDKVLPVGVNEPDDVCKNATFGTECTAYIIKNGNMDYLK